MSAWPVGTGLHTSAAGALCWEYLRLSLRPAAIITVSCCGLAGLYWVALEPLGARREALVFTSLYSTMLLVYVATLLNCRDGGIALGFERRLYRLPLSTPALVLGRLVPPIVLGSAMYLSTVAFLSLVLGTSWPVTGPLTLLVTAVVWAHALNWSLGSRPALLAACGLAATFALIYWVRGQIDAGSGSPVESWRSDDAQASLFGFVVLCAGVVLALLGVWMDRTDRGPERRGRSVLADMPDETSGADGAALRRTFASARSAQLWLEWRRKGRWLPTYAVFAFAVTLIAGSFPAFETATLLRGALLSSAILFVVAPLVAGLLHGRFDARGGGRLDRLRATRPFSDRSLAWVTLEATLRSTLATWAVAVLAPAATFLLVFWFADESHVLAVVEGLVLIPRKVGLFDFVVASLLGAGAAAGLGGIVLSLALSGNNRLLQVFAVVPVGLVVLGLLIERITGSGHWRTALPYAAVAAAAAFLPLFAIAARANLRRGLLPRSRVAGLSALCAATAILVLARLGPERDSWWLGLAEPRAIALAGWTVAIFLPVLLAPWMLSVNRHR